MQQLLKRTHGDRVIWGIVITLSLISLMVVYSSTGTLAYKVAHGHAEKFLFKQLSFFVVGFALMWLAHRIDFNKYNKYAVILFLISIPLLALTLAFGATLNDGARWIKIPGVGLTIQSSDVAKLALFMFLARQLSKFQSTITDLKVVTKQLFVPLILIVVLIAPANLSTSLMIGFICCVLFFIGRVKFAHIALLGISILLFLLFIYGISKITGVGRATTWESRIMQKYGGQKDEQKEYQALQARIAIAKGGFFGVGPGNSTQRNFLPHPYSDMVYPIIIEEYGMLGGIFVLMLYMIFLWRSIVIFKRCPYAFGAFLAIGLSLTLVFQAFLNMAVGVGLAPVTGQTLPLISMGGSSVLFTSVTIGIILSVSKFVDETELENKKNIQEIATHAA
jgi:cell division protein FtsW